MNNHNIFYLIISLSNMFFILIIYMYMCYLYVWTNASAVSEIIYSILFYSILFYSILFYSILFYSILFYSIPFYSYSISPPHMGVRFCKISVKLKFYRISIAGTHSNIYPYKFYFQVLKLNNLDLFFIKMLVC